MSARLLRTSERLSFKRCRQQWAWGYEEKLKPVEESAALRFGDLIHRALADYYIPGVKRGPKPAERFEQHYHADAQAKIDEGFNVYSDEKWEDALDLGVRMLEAYVAEYEDRDKEWKVLSSEQTFQVPLKVEVPDHGLVRFKYVGTFDGVWQNRPNKSLIIFKEFKTATQIVLDALGMDEQAGGYWTYGPAWLRRKGILGPKANIDHILYTFLRKAARNPDHSYDAQGRKLNQDGSVSKSQPAPYFARQPAYRDTHDREEVHRRVLNEVKDMILCEDDPERVYKNPGPMFMPNCRFCGFKDMCELHETGQDWKALREATMTTWEPYSAHELPERH